MAKEEWGVKRVCPTTGKRFYDLNKDPIVSPYTGEIVEINTGKTKMLSSDTEDMSKVKPEASTAEDEIILDDDVEVDDIDDDLLEDDDDDNVSLDEIADMPDDEE
ncbi:MAG: TIGR02300 family protein [Paracoccaceae bacterium]|jgi:hypothetical protein